MACDCSCQRRLCSGCHCRQPGTRIGMPLCVGCSKERMDGKIRWKKVKGRVNEGMYTFVSSRLRGENSNNDSPSDRNWGHPDEEKWVSHFIAISKCSLLFTNILLLILLLLLWLTCLFNCPRLKIISLTVSRYFADSAQYRMKLQAALMITK